ncbi:MAG: DUF167 domain-containing protein [Dehalococcoidia bacterium]|nr:MAG: DUF167 domain-containing protein [Dehalococcoidia bacterium]
MKIRVKIKPNSRTEELSQEGDSFIVKVKEPPREGKANQAVIKLLAQHFGVPQSRVRIISGLRSRNKVIEVAEEQCSEIELSGA